MRNQRNKRNYIIIGLCAILVIMGVGYAAFSSLLTINGTANISNSWCLGFDNTKTNTMQVTKGISTGANPTGSMSYSGTACSSTLQPNASLSATFHQPGDQIEYTLTIKNASTVTAAIKSILVDNESVTSNTTRTKDNITYVINMPLDTTLSANEETTMTIIAKVQNETPISGVYTGETKSINVKINAEQDDGNGGFTPTQEGFTGTIYRHDNAPVYIGDSIVPTQKNAWCAIHSEYGSSCDFGYIFNSEEDCLSQFPSDSGFVCQQSSFLTPDMSNYPTDPTTLNKKYYLRHDVVNNIITASYVCFQSSPSDICMKGGDGGASYLETKAILDSKGLNDRSDDHKTGFWTGGWSGVTDEGLTKYDIGLGNSCEVNTTGSSSCMGSGSPRS